MKDTEQFIRVIGRRLEVSKNLQQVLQEDDNMSEKVKITMPRFYDEVDFDSKLISLYLRTPMMEEVVVDLNTIKTTLEDSLEFDFVFTEEMTKTRGWADLVIVVMDTEGYKWSTAQATKAVFISSNFTNHEQAVPPSYYVDLVTYKAEILKLVAEAKADAGVASSAANTAVDAATRAEGSASSAASDSATALDSATKAKASEVAANASKVAASTSATNAKTSETNAKTSETNSASSAAKAKTSETNAKASETSSATNAEKAETQANRAELEAGKAASASVDAIKDKVGLNGVYDTTRFDFEESKIVQDGLINTFKVFNLQSTSKLNIADTTSDFNLVIYNNTTSTNSSLNTLIYNKNSVSDMRLKLVGGKYNIACWVNDTNVSTKIIEQTSPPKFIILSRENNNYVLSTDKYSIKMGTAITNLNFNNVDIGAISNTIQGNVIVGTYNRFLLPQELNHNFNILNNSPSLSHLNTIDTDGNISKYKLSTDTNHVDARGGILQDKINEVYFKQNGQDFTVVNGKIEVNNGLEGWVNKAKIEGQTVKNELYDYKQFVKNYGATPTYQDDGILINTDGESQFIFTLTPKPNTEYEINYYVENSKDVGSKVIALFRDNTKVTEHGMLSGENTHVINSQTAATIAFRFYTNIQNGLKISNISVIEKSETSKIAYPLPLGLSSTQAIIFNNGQSYEFYEPTIQGKTTVMKAPKGTQNWVEIPNDEGRDTATYDYRLESIGGELGSVPNVNDYVERLNRIEVKNTMLELITGDSSNITQNNGATKTNTLYFAISQQVSGKNQTIPISNIFIGISNSQLFSGDIEGVTIGGTGSIEFRILKSRLSTQDVLGLKEWLEDNPLSVRYQLATPTTTKLTDEQMKAYEPYKKLILCSGVSGVNDTFEIKEDGSGLYAQKAYMEQVSKDGWVFRHDLTINGVACKKYSKSNAITFDIKNTAADKKSFLISDQYSTANSSAGIEAPTDMVGISSWANQPSRTLYLIIPENEAPKDFNITYQLNIPTTIFIPKELVPTILTDKINNLYVDSPVTPSSFTANLPIDKMLGLLLRIEALEAKTNIQPVNEEFISKEIIDSQKQINEVIK